MATTTTTEDELLSPQQVMEITGMGLQTLANWRMKDVHAPGGSEGPPWVKPQGQIGRRGGRVRYPRKQLLAWHAERQRPRVPAVHREALGGTG